MKQRKFWVTLLAGLLVFIAYLGWMPDANAFTEDQKLVLQSWRLVNQSYLDDTFNHQNWWLIRQRSLKKPFRSREEAYTAIEGMLATLDEPFTRFLRPEQYRSLQVSTSGALSGVGLQINLNPETGNLEVISPLAGSPAEAAGIQSRDRILKIDATDTTTLSLDEAAARMRGPKGTTVFLTIQPQDESNIREINLVRDRISLSPVVANLDKENSPSAIGYIRLSQFSANATHEVALAIKKLEKQGAESYILDLRNNPGGLLQAGIEIARLWLPDGTVVYTVNRQGLQDSFTAMGKP